MRGSRSRREPSGPRKLRRSSPRAFRAGLRHPRAMERTQTIVLTGGGTAGHVTPNLALIPRLRERGFRVEYIGSHTGLERSLCEQANIPYHAVAVGKLRRYVSWENLIDPFRLLQGIAQAVPLLGKLGASLVFSKGGFVGVPVVYAAKLKGIPVILHESDLSPGLANRLCIPVATRVCVAYKETLDLLPARAHGQHTGTPIRASLLEGDRSRGQARFGLTSGRPTVLVFGGSQGARAINEAVRELVRLGGTDLQFLHVCGPGNLEEKFEGRPYYRQFEYLHDEFADALACADVVVARGGANSLSELVALHKPAIIIPLPRDASRGDQIENAEQHAAKGFGIALAQSELTAMRLRTELEALIAHSEDFIAAMQRDAPLDSAATLVDLIAELAKPTC